MPDKCSRCSSEYDKTSLPEGSPGLCPSCLQQQNENTAAEPSSSIYVVCAFCDKGFNVTYDHDSESINCENCGKAIDLSGGSQTIVMPTTSDSDIFIDDEQGDNKSIFAKKHDDDSLDSGRMIGGYRLDEVMSEGILGTVYKGEQVNLKRQVSLYVFSEKYAADEALAEAFMDQARKSASLVHPNICRVFDVGVDEGRYFLVSEFVNGISLEERIKKADLLDFVEAAKFGAQAARTLSDASNMGMQHWGLSPGKIIDCGEGNARLMFFGIYHTLFPEGGGIVTVDEPSAIFFSPEQLAGKPVDHRSDLYSLGVSIYCALTGTLPYNSAEIKQVIAGKGVPKVPDMKSMRPDIPDALSDIVKRLIQVDPAKRPESGSEIAVIFEAFAQALESGVAVVDEKKAETAVASAVQKISPERKRRYKRFPTDMTVRIKQSDIDKEKQKTYIKRLKDISENGAFVLDKNPLPIGSFVRMDFQVEESGNRVSVLGVVRWCDMSDGQEGMGIQFLEVSSRSNDKLPKVINKGTAQATAEHLISSALHKKILRFIVMHYGDEVTIADMMKGTGSSRTLFERALADFEGIGLIDVSGESVVCNNPHSKELREAIEKVLKIS
ncbi:MAG: protein kinase domain-containing protein [Planctomycetota bacterium]